jgi:uncharacterized protein
MGSEALLVPRLRHGTLAIVRKLIRPLVWLTVAGATVLAGWAFWWEPRRLVIRETSVILECWQGSPIRIAAAADLHIGSPFVGLAKLERLVSAINAGRPDVVVLLGDFVIQGVAGGRFVSPEQIAAKLSKLQAPLGVYAVLGNHDWWFDAPRVTKAFQSVGVHVIDDAAVELPSGTTSFWLAGVSDFVEGRHDIDKALSAVVQGTSIIVITHNPDVFASVPDHVCLTLAGHTHGGQVAFPVVGRPIVPSIYGERYAIGHIHENGNACSSHRVLGRASFRCVSAYRRRSCS